MADIIKIWPAQFDSRHTLRVLSHPWAAFYFTLGKGKPAQKVERLWFAHRGRILGFFQVTHLVINDGTNIPKLTSISGEESDWQIKPDRWVAICESGFVRLKEKLYHDSFRGWRYFDIDAYRNNSDSRIRPA